MQINDFKRLEKDLGVKFENIETIRQAFIHRSYLNEVKINLPSNERLEFLGDSVLSLIISNYLYEIRPKDSEGELTNLRAYLVKTKSLSQAAKKLNLGSYLKLSRGEEQGGGRHNPQLLANTFEAVLGAIFLDQGFEKAQNFIKKTLLSLFEEELKKGPPKDAKSNLQEITQEKFKQSPHYKIVKTEGPDHAKKFIVAVYILNKEMGKGVGPSKQVAEEQAATQALEKLTHS